MKPFDPRPYISTFDYAALAMREYIDAALVGEKAGIPSYLGALDKYATPLTKGEIGCIIGRPSAGKTLLLTNMARLHAEHTGGVALIVSNEVPLHAMELLLLSMFSQVPVVRIREGDYRKFEYDLLIAGCTKREEHGVIVIGQNEHTDDVLEPLTVERVIECVKYIQNELHIKITWIGQDYLQCMPPVRFRGDSKRLEVNDSLAGLRALARYVGCPLWTTVQAVREVDKYAPYIPTEKDGMETSGIEHAAEIL